MYITREFEEKIYGTFRSDRKQGLILAGIVGCGKTTLVQHCLNLLSNEKKIFQFSGDDFQFRNQVAQDSKYLYHQILSQTQSKSLIFVDEVQKSEAIFDALKYAYDNSETSFLVTGSNPEHLNTIARKRLQRRADFATLSPFSLPEIFSHLELIPKELASGFSYLLKESQKPELSITGINFSAEIKKNTDQYLSRGGLPLAFLSASPESFLEIKKVVERGFETMLLDSSDIREPILMELARIHGQEFTYTNIFKKTGIRRREQVNKIIHQLMGHGYLLAKKPIFLKGAYRSYLSVYSYIDPGIVSYLRGESEIEDSLGARIEGVVHSRLHSIAQEALLKTELGYFKPHKLDSNDNIKFLPGEIDFIYRVGKRIIPIEVKATKEIASINTKLLVDVVEEYNLPFGIVLYGGVPFLNRSKKLVYWPWWGV